VTIIGTGCLRVIPELGIEVTYERTDQWPDTTDTLYTITGERGQIATIMVRAIWVPGRGQQVTVRHSLTDPTLSLKAEVAQILGEILAEVSEPGYNPRRAVMEQITS